MMTLPKITIVTPSYNQGQYLEETIESILDQQYPNLEYIIVDGCSNDCSLSVIRRYEKHLSFWVSEKDRGQTHAINKGFKIATGEIVNWINSDDLLEPGALQCLADNMHRNNEAGVYYGDYRAIDSKSETIYARRVGHHTSSGLYWGRQLSSQPAVFFRRELLDKYGFLDETHHFCMDIEYWVRLAKNGVKFHQIKTPLGVTRVHGDAKTTNLQHVLHDEHKQLLRRYGSLSYMTKGSKSEDLYFTMMNRLWRLISAGNRALVRRDFTFNQASKALSSLEKDQEQ